MNSTKYADIKTFVADVIKPAIVNLRDFLNARIDKLRSDHDDALAKLRQDLWDHIHDYNNPHRTTMQQLATFATFPPSNEQGEIGDVWFEILPQTVADVTPEPEEPGRA